jgi:CBS domain-containing protein
MVTMNKPLLSLIAADLMSQTVIMVPQDMSLSGAARLLSQAQVSGAPVVDAEGRCVGVLSATDFVHWVEKGPKSKPRENVCKPWQIFESEALPREEVRHYMTTDPVTVTSGVHIGELAQKMLDAHIHRVIVVDRNDRPIGIVSSTDILAALAHTALSVEAESHQGLRPPHLQCLGSL